MCLDFNNRPYSLALATRFLRVQEKFNKGTKMCTLKILYQKNTVMFILEPWNCSTP